MTEKQSDSVAPVMLEIWGEAQYPFIAITPRSTLARSGNTWEGFIYGPKKTKLCTYAKLDCVKENGLFV